MSSPGTARRWTMLAIALTATLCTTIFTSGVAFLIPTLHTERQLDLAQAGVMSSLPSFGMVTTLIAWGWVVDRVGERIVLAAGCALTSAAAVAAATTHSLVAVAVFLFIGGMAAASSSSASGRLVVGWFPPPQRGLVMGIRHTGQPLGVGLGALVIPGLADTGGVSAALAFSAIVCAMAAVISVVGVIDPPQPPRAEADEETLANPYGTTPALWRIHATSVLLTVPQAMVWAFALVWLIADRGWSAASAGGLVTAAQLLGAVGRIAAGRWSDRVGSRLRPVRTIATGTAIALGLLAMTDLMQPPISVAVMVIATIASTSDKGLTFTAVAEIAGPFWSGRVLGTHNTSQLLMTGIVPPVFGALITSAGYPAAFAMCAVFPLTAAFLVPVRADPMCGRGTTPDG